MYYVVFIQKSYLNLTILRRELIVRLRHRFVA